MNTKGEFTVWFPVLEHHSNGTSADEWQEQLVYGVSTKLMGNTMPVKEMDDIEPNRFALSEYVNVDSGITE